MAEAAASATAAARSLGVPVPLFEVRWPLELAK